MVSPKVQNGTNLQHKNSSANQNKLQDKVFEPRNSLLTELYEIKHFSSLYRIFLLLLLAMFMNRMITDFLTDGKWDFGLKPVHVGFEGLHYGLLIWAAMQLVVLLVFPAFKIWALATRTYFSNPSSLLKNYQKQWNYLSVILVISYQLTFLVQFTKIISSYKLGGATAMGIIIELIRFMMKSHAFIRSNVPRVFNKEKKDDSNTQTVAGKTDLPTFNMYLYFLFAPTLLYRDEYPRTQQISWKFVIMNILEIFGIIYLMSFLFEKYYIPQFQDVGKENSHKLGYLLLLTLNFSIPGLLCMVSGFYLVLHSWLNATSEILKFADRKFYADWWNCTNYSNYYRTWNIVVHEWLYFYIYRDCYQYVFKKNAPMCQLMVFITSVLFHEYVVAYTVRFFYPVMILFFGFIGVPCSLIWKEKSAMGNMFLLFSLSCGMGMMISLYMIEYFARINCPDTSSGEWWDLFVPRSFRC